MKLGLERRVALVAAASRGLGRAVAEELAAEGAEVAICAREEAALSEARRAIESAAGGRVVARATDLSRREEVESLVRFVLDELGGVDVLVTNAGGPPAGPFESHPPEAWRAAVATNLESALELTRGVLPGMKERRWGRIINITSVAVKQPVDGLILSNAVRAAVTGFARTLANEVGEFGITVNNVLPGYTLTLRLEQLAERLAEARDLEPAAVLDEWTAQVPLRRLGEPRELAALVAFLASERAAYITGTSIPVDGGWVRSLL